MKIKTLNQNNLKQLLGQGYTRGFLGEQDQSLTNSLTKHKGLMIEESDDATNPIDPIFNAFSADHSSTRFNFRDRLLRILPLDEPAVIKLHSSFEEVANKFNYLVLGEKLLESNKDFNTEPLSNIFKDGRQYMEIASKANSTVQANHVDYASGLNFCIF
jgi:hypothetical protein